MKIIVVVIAIVLVIVVTQAMLRPWSRSLTGGPTLTGTWVADTRPAMLVKIEAMRWKADECSRDCDVEGTIDVCAAPGAVQRYTFDGDVRDRHASEFALIVLKANDISYGQQLGNLKGRWGGDDTVELAGEWTSDPPRQPVRIVTDSAGNTVMSPHPEPVRRTPAILKLHRGREQDFAAACH